ncbi:MAG: hypothetical protein OXU23_17550 [Candidatus Poribacteria bacterium]|nr:hypothetical protein [Candidatus Poribacteria bacterium]
MYTHYVYGAYCHQCGDISIMPAEKNIHIGLAKNHHESTDHTCEVHEETKSVVLHGRIPQVVSNHDTQVIALFD